MNGCLRKLLMHVSMYANEDVAYLNYPSY